MPDLHSSETQMRGAPAWSQEPVEDYPETHTWRAAGWRAAGIVAFSSVVVVGSLALWSEPQSPPYDQPTQATQDTQTTQVTPAPALQIPPDIAPKDVPDVVYQRAYSYETRDMHIDDLRTSINYAHTICDYMQLTGLAPDLAVRRAAESVSRNPSLAGITAHDAHGIVIASARVYCPRFDV
jgi:hypothetical protein